MCRPNKKSPPHLFHKQCYLRQQEPRKCPHCESTEQPLLVQLKLHMSRVPVELLQTSSKMTFPKANKIKEDELAVSAEKGSNDSSTCFSLPDGKTVSTEGLPEGISDQDLKKVRIN